jgi:hypothetical protein
MAGDGEEEQLALSADGPVGDRGVAQSVEREPSTLGRNDPGLLARKGPPADDMTS